MSTEPRFDTGVWSLDVDLTVKYRYNTLDFNLLINNLSWRKQPHEPPDA